MALISYSLVMSETEIKKTDDDMKKVMKHLNTKMNKYIEIVEEITKESIINGRVHDNLELYLESVKKLKDTMKEEILVKANQDNKAFPKDFDEADDILF